MSAQQSELLTRIRRGLIEAADVVPALDDDGCLTLAMLDGEGNALAFATLDYDEVGRLIDVAASIRLQMAFRRTFRRVGHA